MSQHTRRAAVWQYYPLTTFYTAAVVAIVGVSQGWFRLDASLIGLALVGMLLQLSTTHREIVVVHHLVNSQRDELKQRIAQLVNTLNAADVAVPKRPTGEDS